MDRSSTSLGTRTTAPEWAALRGVRREFLNVNGKAQQGLVRFARAAVAPYLDGLRLSATSMNLTGVAHTGSIRLSWPGLEGPAEDDPGPVR